MNISLIGVYSNGKPSDIIFNSYIIETPIRFVSFVSEYRYSNVKHLSFEILHSNYVPYVNFSFKEIEAKNNISFIGIYEKIAKESSIFFKISNKIRGLKVVDFTSIQSNILVKSVSFTARYTVRGLNFVFFKSAYISNLISV